MIIVNGQPKSGTTLLQTYLRYCGAKLEPGGLICYSNSSRLIMRGGKPWGDVRSLSEVMNDADPKKVIGAHVSFGSGDFSKHTVVFSFRNLRDVLVSSARWRAVGLDWTHVRREPSSNEVAKYLSASYMSGIVAEARAFHGWMDAADAAICFEDFVDDPPAIGRLLADACGLKYHDPEGMLGDKTPWVTPDYRGTWSGRHSNWEEYWNSEVDSAWTSVGGPAAERLYGYSPLQYQPAGRRS